MTLPTPKQIKQLATACRKAGIIQFKLGEMEFTLDRTTPEKRLLAKGKAKKSVQIDNSAVTSDELSENELLFWSSAQIDENELNGGSES